MSTGEYFTCLLDNSYRQLWINMAVHSSRMRQILSLTLLIKVNQKTLGRYVSDLSTYLGIYFIKFSTQADHLRYTFIHREMIINAMCSVTGAPRVHEGARNIRLMLGIMGESMTSNDMSWHCLSHHLKTSLRNVRQEQATFSAFWTYVVSQVCKIIIF